MILSRPRRAMRLDERSIGPWIDAAILVTLSIALVVATRACLHQHQFDEVVEAAFRDLRDRPDARIAMPESIRRAVPRLLALNSPPILFDPATVSAQGLARRGVTHVLSRDPATRKGLGEALGSSRTIDGFELSTLDQQGALRQPLPAGRMIVWLDSRPYRYRPLSDAAVLEDGVPMRFEAVLDPGRYEFRFDAFSRNGGTVETRVNLPGVARQRDRLRQLALGPLVYPFEVPGPEARQVTISMRATIEEGNHERVGLVNRAELYREP